jgi:hypothetical protein
MLVVMERRIMRCLHSLTRAVVVKPYVHVVCDQACTNLVFIQTKMDWTSSTIYHDIKVVLSINK